MITRETLLRLGFVEEAFEDSEVYNKEISKNILEGVKIHHSIIAEVHLDLQLFSLEYFDENGSFFKEENECASIMFLNIKTDLQLELFMSLISNTTLNSDLIKTLN